MLVVIQQNLIFNIFLFKLCLKKWLHNLMSFDTQFHCYRSSVLGPILFIIYTNDILDNMESEGFLFENNEKIQNYP